jgi:hypothetical protein
MTKEIRSADQLEVLIMNEARPHTVCSDLTGVIVARSSGDRDWTVSQLRNSTSSACAQKVESIASRLQRLYRLAR